MPIAKRVIGILVGWGKKPVNDFYIVAKNICERISEKPVVFKPPVDLAALKAELGRFESVIAAATYGDSTVIVKRDSLRSEIHVMLRQLALYVEYLCNIETNRPTRMNIVAQSGFEAMSSTAADVVTEAFLFSVSWWWTLASTNSQFSILIRGNRQNSRGLLG
jgi:hypothetical protein